MSNLSPSLNSISYSKESWKGYISLLILHFINHAFTIVWILQYLQITCVKEKRGVSFPVLIWTEK